MIDRINRHIKNRTFLSAIKKRFGRAEKSLLQESKDLQNQIDLATSHYEGGDMVRADNKLGELFKNHLDQNNCLPQDLIDKFNRALIERRMFKRDEQDSYKKILEQVVKIDHALLPCKSWRLLNYLCNFNGMFQLGAIIRDKAIKSACDEAYHSQNNFYAVFLAFKAATDQGDLQRAKEYLYLLNKMPEFKGEKSEVRLYFALIGGSEDNYFELALEKFTANDNKFLSYIKDKSVAVVGPAPSEENNGEEIDAYDVVIRTNYRGKDKLAAPEVAGTKTDVGYYNGMDSSSLNDLNDLSFLKDLDHTVFKSIKYPFQSYLLENGKARILYSPGKNLFYNAVTMLQLILFDILHFKPKKIKVFNVNYFLSDKPYNSKYRPDHRISNMPNTFNKQVIIKRWDTFTTHELITSINFDRNLWKARRIEFDRACKDVIMIDPCKFMKEIERVYCLEPAGLQKQVHE